MKKCERPIPWLVNQLSNRGGDEAGKGLRSTPSTLTYTICNSKTAPCAWLHPLQRMSGELAEGGDPTSILACSCPGDFVTSGISPTHPDILLYFKGAIIELLKYVFTPSH